MTKKDYIIEYLKRNGYPARLYKSIVKTEYRHGKYTGYTKVIKTMQDAQEFLINDKD